MAVITIQQIEIVDNPGTVEPDIQSFPIAGGATYKVGAVLVLTSGVINEVANNPALVLGLALHDAAAIYQSGTPSATTLFGKSIANTKAFSGDPLWQRTLLLHNNQYFEISYTQALATTTPGTTAGFTKDAASGFWVLDNSLANKPVTIVQAAGGPASFKGVSGDTFGRVIAVVNTLLQF